MCIRDSPILIGKAVTTASSGNVVLLPQYGNRHGLVAGATGTGKTVTLMTLAEGFSRLGVPVFLADVKGDVAGLAMPGSSSEKLQSRIAQLGIADYKNEAAPVVFWDLWGKAGHPVRTTVSEMGPTLLGRILELNDTQSGVLDILFKPVSYTHLDVYKRQAAEGGPHPAQRLPAQVQIRLDRQRAVFPHPDRVHHRRLF